MIIDQTATRTQTKARIRGVFFVLTLVSLVPTVAWLFWLNVSPNALASVQQEPNTVVKFLTIAGAVILALLILLIITILAAGIAGAIALAIAALGWAIGIYNNARTTDHSEQGLLPIHEIDITPWYLRIFGVKWLSTTDPNRQIPAVGVVQYWPWGAVTTTGGNYGASADEQHEYNQNVLSVRMAAAGKKTLGKYEVLAQHGLLPQQQQPAALPAAQSLITNHQSPLTLSSALNRSAVDNLILGATDTNQPCGINLRNAVHLAIVGASGCGKTASSGYQLALSALKTGYRTLILDPKEGMDWKVFNRAAEWHPTDPTLIEDQLHAVYTEYERRMDIAAKHSVRHIADLNQPAELPPILLIMEEYGDLCRELLRLRQTATIERMDSWIDTIASKGRAADVHIAFIDQYPDQWSPQILMATKAKIVYQVGPGQGNKIGEWHAERLPDNGRFLHRQTEYNAWHVAPHLPTLLRALPPHRYPPLLTDANHSPFVDNTGGVSNSGTNATNGPMNAPTNAPANEPSDASNKWSAIAADWIAANHQARQADLARHMATLDGRPTEYENYRSIAFQMWHIHHPEGRNYTPPAPSMLTGRDGEGCDIFGNSIEVIDLDNPSHAEEIAALRAEIARGNITIKGKRP
jgi:hypothetical protein